MLERCRVFQKDSFGVYVEDGRQADRPWQRGQRGSSWQLSRPDDKDGGWGGGNREAEPCRDVGIIGRSKCHGLAAAWMMGSGGEGGVESDFWLWGQWVCWH